MPSPPFICIPPFSPFVVPPVLPTLPRPFKLSSYPSGPMTIGLPLLNPSILCLSLIPSAVRSPVIVLCICQLGIAFCCLFAAASASRSFRTVSSSLSVERTIPTPSSFREVPDDPATLRPDPGSLEAFWEASEEVKFLWMNWMTSNLAANPDTK